MVVGEDGRHALPWIEPAVRAAMGQQRGHAMLLHAAPGDGALAFALTLAQAWLCEANAAPASPATWPCGRCGSCKLIHSRLHPDLFVLLPEEQRRAHGWLLRDDKVEGEEAKRKPSRQIRIDEVRAATDWVCNTTSRGRGKVVVLHPAVSLNQQSASALLKSLEEPPAGTRWLLSASNPEQLLPTVRSRCQRLRLGTPPAAQALEWLAGQGVKDAEVLQAASGGHPLDSFSLQQAGVDAAAWSALPRAVAAGQSSGLQGWPIPLAVDALQKLCHDAMVSVVGGAPRFFKGDLPRQRSMLPALLDWAAELRRVARHEDHPWNEGLLLESLVSQGRSALTLKP